MGNTFRKIEFDHAYHPPNPPSMALLPSGKYQLTNDVTDPIFSHAP